MLLQDLRGLPILPGTKIALSTAASTLQVGYFEGPNLYLDNRAEYDMLDLGTAAADYTVTIESPNAFLYGKLVQLNRDRTGTEANLTLFMPVGTVGVPNAFADNPDAIRIPVYTKKSVNLGKYFYAPNTIKNFYIDANPETSSGVADSGGTDSTDNSSNPDGMRRTDGYNVEFGAFTGIFTKPVRLYAQTDYGWSHEDLTLVSYAPVPQITALSGATVR